MNNQQTVPGIKRVMNPYKDANVGFLAVGFWVSSILAAILAIPSVLIFVYVFVAFDSILAGALLAFGIHFSLLSISDRISRFLVNVINANEQKPDIHGFMASDFFTFETDEENVVILSIYEDGKERKDIQRFLLEHQVFHVALNKYSKKTPKLTY
tara:strand:- start:3070 stop:3534 length:465 start_codon:yes stop_codon:yes gene_type:complete